MILAAPACIDLCPFLCSPMKELGAAELTSSVSFFNAGIVGGKSYFSLLSVLIHSLVARFT